MIKTTTVLPNQSIMDIVIQEYGDHRAYFEFCQLNNLSLTQVLTPGTTLKVDTDSKYYNAQKLRQIGGNKVGTYFPSNGILVGQGSVLTTLSGTPIIYM
jgi:hypothetical protein